MVLVEQISYRKFEIVRQVSLAPYVTVQIRPCLDKKILDFDIVALSFLFDKHYSIIE